MKSALEKRILVFAFVVLTLTITINALMNIDSFRRDYRDGILLRCQSLAEGLKMSLENVLALGVDLDGLVGISDRCRNIVATDPEIAYCLVEDTVGKPLYSSDNRFRFSQMVEMVSALNKTTALVEFPPHERYYDVSLSVYGSGGELSGRIRIGFSEAVLTERIGRILQRSLAVLLVAFMIVFGAVIVFAKRDLINPITRLRSVATEIAGGNFAVTVPPMSTSDFSELASALGEMAVSLQRRDDQIREGYQELEETNRQLQDSYENLEKIGAELGRSREMYRSLLEEASDAIVVTDEEDRIILTNKAAESFFGIERQKTAGRNFFSFLEEIRCENLDQLYDLHSRVVKGETIETEFSFHLLADQTKVGWLRASPVSGRDGQLRVQSIIRDVTREREIKENLENSTRELKRLNQMKDSFLGVASHELKTPLTVIIGYTELLLGEWHDRLDPTVHGMIEHIANASERLSNIVRDMVDVTMLEYQKMQLRKRPVDLNQVVERASRELGLFFNQRNQQLIFDLEEGLPLVSCDPDRIAQVISNLVGNAIKFTPDGGRVVVKSRLMSCLRAPVPVLQNVEAQNLREITSSKHIYVDISIRDNGIGIDAKDQPYVFDKFYEVGNIEEHFTGKVAFKGKGTGLGLTIVRGIADMHGGEVWVESPGNDPLNCPGSEFHVLIPLDADRFSRRAGRV